MATQNNEISSYRLSYTGDEVNARLGKLGTLLNQYDGSATNLKILNSYEFRDDNYAVNVGWVKNQLQNYLNISTGNSNSHPILGNICLNGKVYDTKDDRAIFTYDLLNYGGYTTKTETNKDSNGTYTQYQQVYVPSHEIEKTSASSDASVDNVMLVIGQGKGEWSRDPNNPGNTGPKYELPKYKFAHLAFIPTTLLGNPRSLFGASDQAAHANTSKYGYGVEDVYFYTSEEAESTEYQYADRTNNGTNPKLTFSNDNTQGNFARIRLGTANDGTPIIRDLALKSTTVRGYNLYGNYTSANGIPTGKHPDGAYTQKQIDDLFENLVTGEIKFSGAKSFKDDVNFDANIAVDKNTELHGTLTVDDKTHLKNELEVNKKATLNDDLEVNGNASVKGTFKGTGAATFENALTVKGDSTLKGNLTVADGKSTTLGGTLKVKQAATFDDTITAAGKATLKDSLEVIGVTKLNNHLEVDGKTTFNNNIIQTEGTALFKDTTINGTLHTTDDSTLDGNVTVGTTEAKKKLIVNGSTTVTDNTDIGGTLEVKENTTLKKDLSVEGDTFISGDTFIDGDTMLEGFLDVADTLNVAGDTTLESDLIVKGESKLGGNVTISGDTTLNGNVSFNGDIPIVPDNASDYDLLVLRKTNENNYKLEHLPNGEDDDTLVIVKGVPTWGPGKANVYFREKTSFNTADTTILDAVKDEGAAGTIKLKPNDIVIIKTIIDGVEHDLSSYIAYFKDDNTLDFAAITGNVDANKVILREDITMAGKYDKIGNYNKNSETELKKLSTKGQSILEFITDMLKKVEQPDPSKTVQPSVSGFSLTSSGAKEAGTKITSASFGTAALSSGSYEYGPPTGIAATSYSIDRICDSASGLSKTGIVSAASGTDNNNGNGFIIGDQGGTNVVSSLAYKVTVNYDQGAVAYDNIYESSSPEYRISAGSKTQTTSAMTPYRNYFYGTVTGTTAPTINSTFIRSLTASGKAYAAPRLIGTTDATNILKVPAGSTGIYIACIATAPGVTKVVNKTAMSTDITSVFTKQQNIAVEGANEYTAVNYNVWYYRPAVAFSGDTELVVTLG